MTGGVGCESCRDTRRREGDASRHQVLSFRSVITLVMSDTADVTRVITA